MKRRYISHLVFQSILLLLCVLEELHGGEWPQWRGPGRDGVWSESGVVKRFEEGELPIRWRAVISSGYSGPTVAEGRVYVMDRVQEPEEAERVLCFEAMSGRPVWSKSYGCRYRRVGYPAGPRASVTITGGRAYSLGSMGHLYCFEADTGKVLWNKDLNEKYNIRMPPWGLAASPVVEGGLVIVQIGGREGPCLAAFEVDNGRERWGALKDRASYSSPIVIDQAGRRVLVGWTGERVAGLDPATGRVLWEWPFPPSRMPIGIATPVWEKNFLLVSSFYDGSLLLKLDTEKPTAEKVWRRKGPDEKQTDSLHCCISTPLIQGDYIYGVDSFGQFRCLELMTGDRVWESQAPVPKARWSNIHMVRNGDTIWMFNERGDLIISRLSGKGYEEISRVKLIKPTRGQLNQRGGVCWSHPAYAYKHIYIRNDEELVCASLEASK